MTTWSEEELYGLADFDFGVSTGWSLAPDRKMLRTFESPHFIAHAVALEPFRIKKFSRTTILFEADQILPEMLAVQNKMQDLGWSSRKKDPANYAIWNTARSAQAKIFKGLVKQLQEESPEFATVLDGRGGTLAARGLKDPQLWREPLIIPIGMFTTVVPMWVETITIHKRSTELDQGNITHY